jgi:hypothetical protein
MAVGWIPASDLFNNRNFIISFLASMIAAISLVYGSFSFLVAKSDSFKPILTAELVQKPPPQLDILSMQAQNNGTVSWDLTDLKPNEKVALSGYFADARPICNQGKEIIEKDGDKNFRVVALVNKNGETTVASTNNVDNVCSFITGVASDRAVYFVMNIPFKVLNTFASPGYLVYQTSGKQK